MSDNINHPKHYTSGKYEIIDIIEGQMTKEEFTGYCVGNILKYTFRYKNKNGIEDLKKAQWYLGKLIQSIEGGKNV